MKYIINIIEIDSLPDNYFSRESWPSEGIYRVKSETYSLYHVSESSVNYISYPQKAFLSNPFKETPDVPTVPEELFLKSLAAINGKIL